jgi:hypothetical protein
MPELALQYQKRIRSSSWNLHLHILLGLTSNRPIYFRVMRCRLDLGSIKRLKVTCKIGPEELFHPDYIEPY